jgi:hypothetical protein
MKFSKYLVVFILSFFFIAGALVVDAAAQSGGKNSAGSQQRPVVVQRVYYVRDPFWYDRYWGWSNPYYGRYYSPYQAYRDQLFYLEGRVRGNRSELEKHLKKYNADGVITAKEQKELDDDYKDLDNSIRELEQFQRYRH